MIEYSPIITPALIAIVVMIGIIAALRELNKFRHVPREEGTEEDYERLCQELNPSVSSDEEYEIVQARAKELVTQDRESEDSKSNARRLTQNEIRYLRELQNAAWSYAESHPWVQIDAHEKANMLAQVELIEGTIEQAQRLVSENSLKYREARILLDRAIHCASHTRDLLAGRIASDKPFVVLSLLQDLDSSVPEGLRDAKKALRLYVAEEAGLIQYEVNVGTLINRASQTECIDEAVSLLRRALKQAKSPDADESPTDLPRSKTALGLILWFHQEKYQEALSLLRSAARDYAWEDNPEEVFDLLGDIASLSQRLEDYNQAEEYLELQSKLLDQFNPGNHSSRIRNLEARARLYETCQWIERAEKAHKQALQLAEKRHDDIAIRNCLKGMAFFLSRQSRFREATKLLDRYMAMKDRFYKDVQFLTPKELRLFAECYEKCNRLDVSQYYKAKAQIAQQKIKRLEAESEKNTSLVNVLSYRITSWLVRDSFR